MQAFIISLILFVPFFGFSQGMFLFSNVRAPTRIGAVDGPLAGPGIWAQMLVGTNSESLTPVALPREHRGNGFVSGFTTITVPDIDGGTLAYVQMWAWDGARWGTSLAGVPNDQLGKTDIVPIFLTFSFDPQFAPLFNQSAIVPIPEPSAFALTVVGAGVLWFAARTRRRASFPRPPAPK